jgi:hypothetical protein
MLSLEHINLRGRNIKEVYRIASSVVYKVVSTTITSVTVLYHGKPLVLPKSSLYLHPYYPAIVPEYIEILMPMFGHVNHSLFPVNEHNKIAIPRNTNNPKEGKTGFIKYVSVDEAYNNPIIFKPIYPARITQVDQPLTEVTNAG